MSGGKEIRPKKKKKAGVSGPLKQIFPKMKIIVKSTKTISFDESDADDDSDDDTSQRQNPEVVVEEAYEDDG